MSVITLVVSTTITNLESRNIYDSCMAKREIDPGLLVGAPEIAERLGLARPQVVHNWRYRHTDFPVPVAELRQGNVWYWPDVEEWLKATSRL
jgi:predicted DNA-binding transcriptional regulator AlpA